MFYFLFDSKLNAKCRIINPNR